MPTTSLLWTSPLGLECSLDAHALPVWTVRPGLAARPDEPAPVFLLGNHRLTSFAHVDGRLHLFSLDRAAARLNPGAKPEECASFSRLKIRRGDNALGWSLSGPGAPITRTSAGCGWAAFTYMLDGLEIERRWETAPSEGVGDGCPALLFTVTITNTRATAVHLEFEESLEASYDPDFWRDVPHLPRRAGRPVAVSDNPALAGVVFRTVEEPPFGFERTNADSCADARPAGVRWSTAAPGGRAFARLLRADRASVGVRFGASLGPGTAWTGRAVVSVTRQDAEHHAAADMLLAADPGELRAAWALRVPSFASELDPARRAELRWHAAVLDMLANHHEATGETYIPQGAVHGCTLGCSAVIRDHLSHGLPLCYYNPALARSLLRFAAKRMSPDGAICSGIEGEGRIPFLSDQEPDSQLYFFLLAAEYLQATRDHRFVLARVTDEHDFLDRLVRAFAHLREAVSRGPHRLVHVLRSGRNGHLDRLFGALGHRTTVQHAERQLNTAMAIVVLGRLADALAAATAALPADPRLAPLATDLRAYRGELLDSFLIDRGEHPFPAREQADELVRGRESLALEPAPWILLIPEIPFVRREAFWREARARLRADEPKSSRRAEHAVEASDAGAVGVRENAGLRFELHDRLAAAVHVLDPDEGTHLAEGMSLRSHAVHRPAEWIGLWSATDSSNSAILGSPGEAIAPHVRPFPPYCAHAHAWPLWCALRAAPDLTANL